MALKSDNFAFLFGIESTEGVDPGLSASDFIAVQSLQSPLNPDVIDVREHGGGLGAGTPIIGALKPTVTAGLNMRGSGAAATPPIFGRLLRVASMSETVVAVIPSSGTTPATGGTTKTITFDRSTGTGTQWSGTSGSYIGHPIELGGDVSPALSMSIIDYSVSGNTVTITVGTTLAANPTTSTTIKKLPHVGYAPVSTEPIPSGTGYVHRAGYASGVLWKFVGMRADISLSWRTGQPGTIEARLGGKFLSKSDAAMPAVALPTIQPPIFLKGHMTLDSNPIGTSEFSFGLGNGGFYEPDANLDDGIVSYDLANRNARGAINPRVTLVATRDLVSAYLKAGVPAKLAALLGPRTGGAAGTRFSIVVPAALPLDASPVDDSIVREQVPFAATGYNGECYLAQF